MKISLFAKYVLLFCYILLVFVSFNMKRDKDVTESGNLANTNRKITNNNIVTTKEQIFKEIFLFDINQKESNSTLDRLKYQDKVIKLNEIEKKFIVDFNSKLLNDIKKRFPNFFVSFNNDIQSGNPVMVQEALTKGGNIIYGFMYKKLSINSKDLSLNSANMTTEDIKMMEELYRTTDYKRALNIIEIGKKNGFFKRSFKYSRGSTLGFESFNMPSERPMDIKGPPPTLFSDLNIIQVAHIALNENIGVNINLLINVQVFIHTHVAINVPFQGFPEKNLLQEKVVREITLNYKR